jgi:hypothetical protein
MFGRKRSKITRPMKKFRNPVQAALPLIVGAAAILLLAGCTTTPSGAQALVCPKCKEVTVTRTVAVADGDGNLPFRRQEVTETDHSCPGCQSAWATLFKQGKFQHVCAICEAEALTCPSSHR